MQIDLVINYQKSGETMSLRMCPAVMTAIFFCILISESQSLAQEVPRVEVGVHVTALSLGDFKLKVPDLSKSERGVGGRVSVNFTNSVALEAEYNIFPTDFRITVPQLNQLVSRKLTRDRVNQFLMGIKAGAHYEHFGIFAKIRPGFVSTNLKDETINPNPTLNSLFRTSSGLALDFGGVLEFYPTRHSMLRFDVADMITHYETKSVSSSSTTKVENRKFTSHNLQLTFGVGLRF